MVPQPTQISLRILLALLLSKFPKKRQRRAITAETAKYAVMLRISVSLVDTVC